MKVVPTLSMAEIYFDPQAPEPTNYSVVALPSAVAETLGAGNPVWREAQVIEWGPQRYRTRFQACWDREALHVRWDALDDGPWHTMTKRDEHIWEEEVVEIFLDADHSGRNYYELEINPVNVVCDLRVERPWPSLKSLTDWNLEGLATSVVPLKDMHGTVEGWSAIARLPFAGLESLYPAAAVALPPQPGATWWFNVFRIKRPGGPAKPDEGAVYAAWSRPSGPSFHDPAAFRRFTYL